MYTRAMKRRIYVDASVVGGCEDEEFAAHSLQLLESFVIQAPREVLLDD
jgi:hypothetical protein